MSDETRWTYKTTWNDKAECVRLISRGPKQVRFREIGTTGGYTTCSPEEWDSMGRTEIAAVGIQIAVLKAANQRAKERLDREEARVMEMQIVYDKLAALEDAPNA